MSTTKTLLKSAGKQSANLAKQIAKESTHELLEIPKQAPRSAVGLENKQTPPAVETKSAKGSEVHDLSKEEEKKIKEQGLVRVREIDAEMEKIRKEKSAGLSQSEDNAAPSKQEIISTPGEPLLPSSPTPRGAQPGASKKARKTEAPLGKY